MDEEYIKIIKEMKKDLKELKEIIHKFINSYEEKTNTNKFDDLLKEMEEIC